MKKIRVMDGLDDEWSLGGWRRIELHPINLQSIATPKIDSLKVQILDEFNNFWHNFILIYISNPYMFNVSLPIIQKLIHNEYWAIERRISDYDWSVHIR